MSRAVILACYKTHRKPSSGLKRSVSSAFQPPAKRLKNEIAVKRLRVPMGEAPAETFNALDIVDASLGLVSFNGHRLRLARTDTQGSFVVAAQHLSKGVVLGVYSGAWSVEKKDGDHVIESRAVASQRCWWIDASPSLDPLRLSPSLAIGSQGDALLGLINEPDQGEPNCRFIAFKDKQSGVTCIAVRVEQAVKAGDSLSVCYGRCYVRKGYQHSCRNCCA